jgi:hypothetical protein
MDPEIKRKWVNALRSGTYVQGKGYLKKSVQNDDGPRQDTYCCLGVLCELAVQEGVIPPAGVRPGLLDTRWQYGPEFDQTWSDLPSNVVHWADLDNADPIVPGHGRLSTLNDNGNPFTYIADLIEGNL